MKDISKNLSISDIDFACECVKNWIKICLENNIEIKNESAEHSVLLRRLLSGKIAHEQKPPLRFGYPAWELVEREENEIKELLEDDDGLIIDQHPGYLWLNREFKTIVYPRLNLYFQYEEKDCLPQIEFLGENSNPEDFKYKGKFLKKIEPLNK